VLEGRTLRLQALQPTRGWELGWVQSCLLMEQCLPAFCLCEGLKHFLAGRVWLEKASPW